MGLDRAGTMMASVLDSFSSPLARSWDSRLRRLRSLLARYPSSYRVGYWRIQIKILPFLLERYGDDPHIRWHDATSSSRRFEIRGEKAVAGGNPPKSAAVIRELLRSIADANRGGSGHN